MEHTVPVITYITKENHVELNKNSRVRGFESRIPAEPRRLIRCIGSDIIFLDFYLFLPFYYLLKSARNTRISWYCSQYPDKPLFHSSTRFEAVQDISLTSHSSSAQNAGLCSFSPFMPAKLKGCRFLLVMGFGYEFFCSRISIVPSSD